RRTQRAGARRARAAARDRLRDPADRPVPASDGRRAASPGSSSKRTASADRARLGRSPAVPRRVSCEAWGMRRGDGGGRLILLVQWLGALAILVLVLGQILLPRIAASKISSRI